MSGRPKRILMVNWRDLTHPLAGGAEVEIEEMAKRWRDRGHQVTIFCSSYKGAPDHEERNGVRILRYGNRFSVYPMTMSRYLRSSDSFDVIFESVNTVPFFMPTYARVPVISLLYEGFTRSIGELLLTEIAPPLAASALLLQSLIPLFYQKTHVIVISESAKRGLVSHGLHPSFISVIPPGIDPRFYENYDTAAKPFTENIVFLGRLKRYKGVLTLIRAFGHVLKRHRDAHLVIVGKGDLLPDILGLTKELDLTDSVAIRGFVSEGEKAALLSNSAVVACPSIHDTWSIAVAEAMAMGAVPVVSSTLGEMIIESGTGAICRPGDPASLAQSINRILADPSKWYDMSRRASKWARENTWDKVADQTLNVVLERLT